VIYSNFVPKKFDIFDYENTGFRYSTLSIQWPWNPGYGHSRSSEPTRIDPPSTTSYYCSIATMGLSRTVSEINGDSGQKLQIFLTHPYILRPCWRGSPWNWVPALGQKLEWWGYRAEKKFIFSSVDTIHQRNRRTDRQTDTGRQQRPRLCISLFAYTVLDRDQVFYESD